MKKKILSFAILFALAILGYIFLREHAYQFKNILQVNLKYIAILLPLTMTRPFLKGIRLRTLTKLYGLNLTFKEWFGLTILITFGNYISPFRAGASIMAVYLKKKYKFPYTFSVSLTGTLYLATFLLFGLLGIFLTFLITLPEEFKYGLILFFIILVLVSIFLLFFLPSPIRTNIRVLKHLANSISEFRRVRNFSFMFKIMVIDFLRAIALASAFYLIFMAFNFKAPFYACVLMAIISELSIIISLTPMGLGIRESIIIITSKLIGADILTGTFVAALDRAIAIILLLFFTPICSYFLFKK